GAPAARATASKSVHTTRVTTNLRSEKQARNGNAKPAATTAIQILVSIWDGVRKRETFVTGRYKRQVSFLSLLSNRGLFRRSPVRSAILRAFAALAIVTAFGIVPAAAQTGQMFGELVGRVTDDQGGALPGVTVTLSGPAVMGTPSVTSSGTGQYRFPAVNSRTYSLKFELAGFAPLLREGIVVPVRQTITVDASMKLASLQETVTVSGSSPTVDVENTKVGARLSQEILTDVPTSRTIFGSTKVLPGMTMGRQDPGGLNPATSTGMVPPRTSNYKLHFYAAP